MALGQGKVGGVWVQLRFPIEESPEGGKDHLKAN